MTNDELVALRKKALDQICRLRDLKERGQESSKESQDLLKELRETMAAGMDRLPNTESKIIVIRRSKGISFRPITPWLIGSTCLVAFVVLAASNGNKAWDRSVLLVVFYLSLIGLLWITWRYLAFETLRGPSTRWYLPQSSARFSIPGNPCIFVRDIDSVTPWYIEQLGLFKEVHIRSREYEVATFKFKDNGKSVILTTRMIYRADKGLRLFTKRIGRMKAVMSARGIDVGPIQQDRQGTRYFELCDPEGNVIEVVDEP